MQLRYLEESKSHFIALKKITAHNADVLLSLHQLFRSSIRNIKNKAKLFLFITCKTKFNSLCLFQN